MTGGARAALAFVALCAAMARSVWAQDTIPRLRHILPIDYARVQPFQRAYDINVLSGDSTITIGQRAVALRQVVLTDSSAGWLLTETRGGIVPAFDSLFLAGDLRPVRWTSSLGASRLEVEFGADSLSAVIRGPAGASAAKLEAPPDLLLSGAMLELVVGLLPLSAGWTDSVYVLSADASGADVSAVEIVVIGDEPTVPDPSGTARWIVALHAESRELRLWVDKTSGVTERTQQVLPTHTGTMLELRVRERAEVMPPR